MRGNKEIVMGRQASRLLFIFVFGIIISGSCWAEDKFVYPEHAGRDPFQPLIDKQGAINVRLIRNKEDLVVNGIIFSETKQESIAIINNESFREGDSIGDYDLTKITPNQVVLFKGDKKVILKMEEENEK